MSEKIKVIALVPVTLYENADEFVFYATKEDVEKGKIFSVPDTAFWQHKINPERLLANAPEKQKQKGVNDEKE